MHVSSDEDLLRNILRLRVITHQAGCGRKNHVLIGAHESGELG
jgi:hypothetical protein